MIVAVFGATDQMGNYIVRTAGYPPTAGINKINGNNIVDFMLKQINEGRYLQQRVGISNFS